MKAGRQAAGYDDTFYSFTSSEAARSAAVLVPYVVDLIDPRSAVDVGCGQGVWLGAFVANGVSDVLGLDGPWVERSRLAIPSACFRSVDLATPIELDRAFDLAVSLEVAEHLPPEAASRFVETLTSLADVVLFSAAIPGQGGQCHVNEQWPSYWVKHFAAAGFAVADCVRFEFWDDDRVAAFYRQNIFVAFRRNRLHEHPGLERWVAAHPDCVDRVPDAAHPALWASKTRHPADRYDAPQLAEAFLRRSYARSRVWLGQQRQRLRSKPSTSNELDGG